MVNIDTFKQTEIRIGKIISAEKVEGLDKILKLQVDFGLKPISSEIGSPEHLDGQDVLREHDIRQILSGIGLTFTDPDVLIGKLCPFVTNLETRTIKDLESQGMILALGDPTNVVLLHPGSDVEPGSLVG